MDRQLTYAGQIPLETDILNSEKNALFGLGAMAQALMGTSTQLVGLACAPTSPASMQVKVGPGAIYSQQAADTVAYGSLATDANLTMKQGLSFGDTLLNCPAPVTAGQSINYLVQFAFGESDGAATVLPYYNAANPAVSYNGPNNTGATNATQRQARCVISVKAGVSAPTGTQTTPSPDANNVVGYVVTVAQGATSIIAGNIVMAPSAPFLFPASQLYAAIALANTFTQLNIFSSGIQLAARTDVASASTVVLLTNYVRITGTTGITAITLANGGFCDVLFGGALTLTNSANLILLGSANLTVAAGDTASFKGEAGGVVRMTAYNPVSGMSPGSLISVSYITASQTFNAVANARFYEIEVQAGGGGGASVTSGVFGCGGGGGYSRKRVSAAAFGASQVVTVGAGGAGGNASAGSGGGTTSVGALLSASGGGAGPVGGTNSAGGVGGTGTGGDLNLTGGGGGVGGATAATPTSNMGGTGGSSFFGGGGYFVGNSTVNTSALAGGNYGGGGGGTNAAATAGPGGAGLVVIRVYA